MRDDLGPRSRQIFGVAMTKLSEFKVANENFKKSILSVAPSESLISFWRSSSKLEQAVKVMDDCYGKLDAMDKALGAYDELFKPYCKKITDQVAKEKNEIKPKAKAVVEKLEHGLESISISYRKDMIALADSGGQDPNRKDVGKGVANAAADIAMKKIIAEVSVEFKKRREAHRKVALEVEQTSREKAVEAASIVDRMNKLVSQAMNNKKAGKLRENQMLALSATQQAGKVKTLADEAQDFYDRSLEPYFAERNMTIATVSKQMGHDIPKDYANLASKEAEKHSKIFTEATKLTAAAKLANAKSRSAAEQAAQILEQVNDVVAGRDVAQSFLKGAANAAMRAKTMVDEATVDGEKLKVTTIPNIGRAMLVKQTGKPENELASVVPTLTTLTPFLETALQTCLEQAETARKMIKDERQKIPGEYLKGQIDKIFTTIEGQIDKLDELLTYVQKIANQIIPRAQEMID
jgi:hypothetical protein